MLILLTSSAAFAGSISTAGIMAGPDGGAATPNVASVVYNPGALGGIDGFTLMLDAQATAVRLEVTATRNDGIDPNTGQPYDVATARAVVPNAVLGFAVPIIENRLVAGFAINDPFVGGGDYTSTETGNPPPYTGHQRYHIIDTAVITVAFTPAVALTVTDGLHVGGGVSYVYDSLSVMQASDPLGTEGLTAEDASAGAVPENPYAMDVYLEGATTGSHWGWNAGIYWDKWEKLQVGASYSGETFLDLSGEGSVTVPEAMSTTGESLTVPANFSISEQLAATARLYANSQLDEKLMVGGGVDWQLWHACCGEEDGDISINITNKDGEAIGQDDGVAIDINPQQYNPRRLWNAMNFAVYGGYQVTEELWAGLRTGYNQNAVPDYAVTPTNLDFQSIPVMIGGRYRFGKTTVGLAYSKFFLLTREITDSAWNLQDGNERFSPSLPSKTNANGTYSGLADSVGLRLSYDL